MDGIKNNYCNPVKYVAKINETSNNEQFIFDNSNERIEKNKPEEVKFLRKLTT